MNYQERGRNFFEANRRNFGRSDLDRIVQKERVVHKKSGRIGELAQDCLLVFQMIKDYCTGKYPMSLTSILMLGGAVAYLIMPIDAIPDMVPVIGYLDDIGVLGYVFKCCHNEISRYRAWREKQIS